MAVVNIDCDFDAHSDSANVGSTSNGTVLVSNNYAFVTHRAQFRFPTSSALAGIAALNSVEMQFNVTVAASTGVQIQRYNNDGTTDPGSDTVANRQSRSAGGTTLAQVNCASTGSKSSGSLAITSEVLSSVSSPGFYALAMNHWSQAVGARVEIEAIENAGNDPATLVVDYVEPNEASIASTLAPLSAALTAGQVFAGTVSATLASLSASFTASQEFPATIAAQLRPLQASLIAMQVPEGQIAATLPPVRGSISATNAANVLQMVATLAKVTASVTASQSQEAEITSTLSKVLGDFAATMVPEGQIDSTLAALSADLTASQQYIATLASILAGVSFDGSASQIQAASIAATLAHLVMSGQATQEQQATIEATLIALSFAGQADTYSNLGQIASILEPLAASVTAHLVPEGAIASLLAPVQAALIGGQVPQGSIEAVLAALEFASAVTQGTPFSPTAWARLASVPPHGYARGSAPLIGQGRAH